MAEHTQTLVPPETERRYRWTRTQYDRLVEAGILADQRVELIHGEIIEMSPQGSRHFTLIRLVSKVLERIYEDGYDIRPQGPLALGEDSEPEPDVAVVRGEPLDYLDAHPTSALLAVEVADTSLMKDRLTKAALYAQHGISEYWILNLAAATLEVHRDPADGVYQTKVTLRAGDTVTPPEAATPIAVADILP